MSEWGEGGRQSTGCYIMSKMFKLITQLLFRQYLQNNTDFLKSSIFNVFCIIPQFLGAKAPLQIARLSLSWSDQKLTKKQ